MEMNVDALLDDLLSSDDEDTEEISSKGISTPTHYVEVGGENGIQAADGREALGVATLGVPTREEAGVDDLNFPDFKPGQAEGGPPPSFPRQDTAGANADPESQDWLHRATSSSAQEAPARGPPPQQLPGRSQPSHNAGAALPDSAPSADHERGRGAAHPAARDVLEDSNRWGDSRDSEHLGPDARHGRSPPEADDREASGLGIPVGHGGTKAIPVQERGSPGELLRDTDVPAGADWVSQPSGVPVATRPLVEKRQGRLDAGDGEPPEDFVLEPAPEGSERREEEGVLEAEPDLDHLSKASSSTASEDGSIPPEEEEEEEEEGGGRGPPSAYLVRLQKAEAVERALLLTGLESGREPGPPLDSVTSALGRQAQAWPPDGAGDGHGGMVGGHTLVRCDAVPLLSDSVAPGSPAGMPTAVASFHSALAVGMSGGAVLVYMPRGLASDGGAAGQPRVIQLADPGSRDVEAVTCLSFSPMGNLLMVGHANGDVALWELKKQGWDLAKTIKDAHVTPVIQCAFLEGSGGGALTADSHGRLVHHNINAYLSLTAMLAGRLTKGSQMSLLLDGRQVGPLTKVAGLFAPMRPPVPPKGAPETADTARHFFFQEGGAAWLEGTALLCSHKGAFVARVGQDGKLGLLHNIQRPPNVRPDCLPYASWRLRSSTAILGGPATPRVPSAALVMGWERLLVLLEVPLARPAPAPAPEGGAPAPPQPTPPPVVTRMWEVEAPVVGLSWMEGPSLALLCEHGPRTILLLYDSSGTVPKERLVLGDSMVPQQYLVNSEQVPEACYHNSVAISPDRILLLASQGVKMVRMMSWQERLGVLREVGQAPAALLAALSILRNAGPPASPLPTDPGAVIWKGEGRGADPRAVADVIQSLLLAYVEDALQPAPDSNAKAGVAADVAIDTCLGLGRPEALWEEVAPRFFEGGQGPALLDALLPRVVSGQLRHLAPEVMQELVEHCAARGRAADVERCVLHLDLASLDFNQVVRLCGEHNLLSALAFLFTRGLKEYQAPAACLLSAVLGAGPEPADRASLAYKLLVYLDCCFQGRSFPPGSGEVEEGERERVRAQMLAFLLHSSRQSLLNSLQPFGGVGQAMIREQLPEGPHPVLRLLTSIDAGAALEVVGKAVQGWDALDWELREAAGLGSPRDGAGLRTAVQTIVDAVLDLLLDPAQLGDEAEHAVEFVAAHLAEGRAVAPPEVVLRVLRHVALGPWPEGGGRPLPQREDRFMAVLKQTAMVRGPARTLGDRQWDAEVQRLARQAGFARAEAHALHLAGNYAAALDRLLQEGPPASAAFDYVNRVLDQPPQGEEEGQVEEVKEAVLGSMQRLTAADPAQAAALVIRHFPRDHSRVLATLEGWPELQYGYLDGAIQTSRMLEELEAEGAASRDPGGVPRPPSAHTPLLSDPQVGELYVKLLCQFKPEEALPFLQSHDNYRVEEVLSFTQQYKVRDAEAYLLERLGDIGAALAIHVSSMEAAAQRLLSDMLEGALPLSRLTGLQGGLRALPGTPRGAQNRPAPPPEAAKKAPLQHGGPQPPPQLLALQGAVGGAVHLCQRHSRDAPAQTVQQLWFSILQSFVRLLHLLRQRTGLNGGRLLDMRSRETGARETNFDASEPDMERKFSEGQRVLTGLMEAVISHMAGYVPLKAIGERIITEFAGEQFGDFKGPLLGLLSAYSYEFASLESTKRLLGSDAFRTLYSMYRARSHPLQQTSLVERSSANPESGHVDGPGQLSTSSSGRQLPAHQPPPRMEVFDALNSGRFGIVGKGVARKGSQREAAGNRRDRAQPTAGSLGGANTEPPSPVHRGGVDLNFLRANSQLML